MAVVSNAVDVATNVNAQSVVFSEQLLPGGGEQVVKPPSEADDSNESSSSSNGGGSGGSITLKEFYWDQILFYLVSAILGLSFLDISVEFFRGSTVQCFTPADLTRDQISYLNNYCYGSLPDSQYYLIFILISALLIIAPHYLWNSYFARHFDFFFDLVKKLDRLRDSNTGEYNPHNYDLVKKLEKKFSKFNTWIYRLYMLKLMAQLLISATVLLANAFYFREADFEETYTCPEILDHVNTTKWPIDSEVTCVYNSLNLLKFLRWAAFILLSLSIVFIIVGLVWGMIRHPNELGAKEIATFSTLSCLPPEEHDFPSLRNVLISILTCKVHENLPSRENMSFEPIELGEDESGRGSSNDSKQGEGCCGRLFESLQHLFHPGISSDLDFLVMKLYFADSGHGQVFKDIQIYKEIQQQQSKDQELLYLLQRIQTDRIDEQIDKEMAKLEAGLPLKDDTDSDFSEEDDLKNRLFKAGLKLAGPGKNPEEAVYEEFQHLMGIDVEDWSYSMLRSVIYGFLDNAPINSFAIDVSFGSSTGYSLVLARAFDHVATFHFNNYYRNLKETFHCEKYQAGYTTITYQEDIFSQEAAKITKCEKPIIDMFKETTDGRSIDLIVIGPINDRSKIATANLLIEKLYAKRKYFKRKSILMAIRPLKVGSKTRMDHFEQYTPPKSIYEDINDKIEKKLAENGVKMYTVTPLGDVRPYQYNQSELTQSSTSRVNTRRRGSSIRHSSDATTSTTGLRRRPSKTLMRLKSFIDAPPDIQQLPRGIAVQCGELECIFEFKIYQYSGRYCVDGKDDTPPTTNNDMPSHDVSHDVSHDNDGRNRYSNNDLEAINIQSSTQSLDNQPMEPAEVLSPTMPDNLPSPILPSTSQSPERILSAEGSPISLNYDNSRSESLV